MRKVFLFATFAAFIRFLLLPEVVKKIHMSPLLPMASICLAKTSSKLKSFPIAVKLLVSVVIDIAGTDFLFFCILNKLTC